jgi:sugar phosphate isomerase/epimerase
MMLDVKSMHLSNVDYGVAVSDSLDYCRHIHVNDPGNTAPGTNGVDHASVAKAIQATSYDGVVSLEMGRAESTPEENIRTGFRVLNEIYNGGEA